MRETRFRIPVKWFVPGGWSVEMRCAQRELERAAAVAVGRNEGKSDALPNEDVPRRFLVAQIFNLPYRRFVIGSALNISGAFDRYRNGRISPSSIGRRGFTLVELLTVIAIIGVLVTLLSTALSSAKRKARQAVCTSNLRQVSLAMNMYLDDEHNKRPPSLGTLVTTKYLPAPGGLLCPEDKSRQWGLLVEDASVMSLDSMLAASPVADQLKVASPSRVEEVPYSYLHPLRWDAAAWDLLMKTDAGAGIAACQLHGLGKQNLESPSIRDFQGLLLRARRDGAVVRRQVFWEPVTIADRSMVSTEGAAPPSFMTAPMTATAPAVEPNPDPASLIYPWRVFTDEPAP